MSTLIADAEVLEEVEVREVLRAKEAAMMSNEETRRGIKAGRNKRAACAVFMCAGGPAREVSWLHGRAG